MRTRAKLLTALLAMIAALSCTLTATALKTAPTLTLQGNEAAPATLVNGLAKATLTLKVADFSEVAGAKLTLKLPEGITLSTATVTDKATSDVWTLKAGQNYKISGNTVTIADVFNLNGAPTKTGALELALDFTVTGTSVGEYTVTVSGDFTGPELEKKTGTAEGNLVIGREKAEYTAADIVSLDSTSTAEQGYFIPAYGAYTGDAGNPTYLTKGSDGKFAVGGVSGNVQVLKCKLPDPGCVTTFGVSKSTVNDAIAQAGAIQFGSYVDEIKAGTSFGTLLIAGDFNDLVEYYKGKGTYDTVDKVLGRLKDLLKSTNTPDGKLCKVTYNNKTKTVYVGKMPQSRYMWRGSRTTTQSAQQQLQYALRIYNISDPEKTYTAVGYTVKDDAYTFSKELKSATLNSLK